MKAGEAAIYSLLKTYFVRQLAETLPLLELPFLVTSGLSFTSVQTAGAHSLADTVHLLGTNHAVFRTDRFFFSVLGSHLPVSRKLLGDFAALSGFNRKSMLTHDPFEIRIVGSFSTITTETASVSAP